MTDEEMEATLRRIVAVVNILVWLNVAFMGLVVYMLVKVTP